MNQLYPLKFNPIVFDKMWGGSKLKNILHKQTGSDKAGESWEISGIEDNVSVVANGFLEGNDLNDLLEVYMGDLVGERIFQKFGIQFPLLIKYIDANDALSIQVHPDDDLALKRHNSFGKTEMWYVMQAEEGSELIVGLNNKLDKETFLKHIENKSITKILNKESVKEGDVFFLPAGRVHAIGAGILLAEIQQSSDVTYRIYDFDRKESNGKYRELHTEQAIDAIDYTFHNNYRTKYHENKNVPVNLANCDYFTTNLLYLTSAIEKDIIKLDCFVIYMCVEGLCNFNYNENEKIELKKGETILIPAELTIYSIEPINSVKLLEVYISNNSEEDSKN